MKVLRYFKETGKYTRQNSVRTSAILDQPKNAVSAPLWFKMLKMVETLAKLIILFPGSTLIIVINLKYD